MTKEHHLLLQELTLLPAAEWQIRLEGNWLALRLAQGDGYWLRPGAVRQLNPGDVVMVLSSSDALLRASSLGPLRIQCFFVCPRLLEDLLNPLEKQHLEALSSSETTLVFFWAGTEAPARQFAALADSHPQNNLATRCKLVQLWTDSILKLLPQPPPEAVQGQLFERFEQLLNQMTEAQFAQCSLGDLAQRLHCSQRHLSRLFQQKFNRSFRTRQAEVRLQRACQILASSDAKIIEVAYESGYHHLGLFNTMFKRHFGVTPSQWRQNARHQASLPPPQPPLAASAALLLLALWLSVGSTPLFAAPSSVFSPNPATLFGQMRL